MVTKGLAAKLLVTTCSSVVFFMSMNLCGKYFNTNLSEEKDWAKDSKQKLLNTILTYKIVICILKEIHTFNSKNSTTTQNN